mgnify:CR=1 FL=1
MAWNLDLSSPIYLQLVDRIKQLIISGTIQMGEKLSSVRDLAQQAGVNPNTMQRALAELEREGLLYSVRTSGRYVTDNKEMIDKMRKDIANQKIIDLFDALNKLGYSSEEISQLIKERIDQLGEEK